MSNTNLTIKLKPRQDTDGAIFFVGKLKIPANIECKDGVTFLVFTSDEGEEQLQIAPFDTKANKK